METIDIHDIYQFKACPLRHQLMQKSGTKSQMHESDGLKEALRSTISYYFYKKQDGYVCSMKELKEKFGAIWYGDMDLYDIKLDGDRRKRNFEMQALEMLQHMHHLDKSNKDEIISVNQDFRVPFNKEFAVKGSIPLILLGSDGYEIVIHKTGNQKYNEFWQRTDMEITLQAMAFHSMFKTPAQRIRIENLKKKETIYVERSKKDYQRLYKSIKLMKESIANGWFYPRESYLCDRCPVQNLCMEWR